jgi:hypothetical protein
MCACRTLKVLFCLNCQICQPFFKLLTLITEPSSGPSGLPCFTQLVLQRIWEVAEFCPQSALDWLAVQVPRNKLAHSWVLQSMETWVEHFLLGHNNQRVRSGELYSFIKGKGKVVPQHTYGGTGRFTPWERTPGTHYTRGWVGPRVHLDIKEDTGKISCLCQGSNLNSIVSWVY